MNKRHPKTPRVTRQCEACGASFVTHQANVRRGGGRFCGMTCRNTGYRGSGNPKWRGGRITDPDGRVMVYAPGHPNATLMGGTHAYEYRMVAAMARGKPLMDDEIVHHINGDVTDNRPENLQVMTQSEHARLHNVAGKFRGVQCHS